MQLIESKPPIKVVVADETELYLKSLVSLLSNDMITVIGSCSNVNDWEEILIKEDNLPDVALVSHKMAGKDSLHRAKLFKERYPSVKIVILTFSSDSSLIEKLVRPYLHSILIKGKFEPREIISLIKMVDIGYIFYPDIELLRK